MIQESIQSDVDICVCDEVSVYSLVSDVSEAERLQLFTIRQNTVKSLHQRHRLLNGQVDTVQCR